MERFPQNNNMRGGPQVRGRGRGRGASVNVAPINSMVVRRMAVGEVAERGGRN